MSQQDTMDDVNTSFEVKQGPIPLGTEITGIDLSKKVSDDCFAEIEKLFKEGGNTLEVATSILHGEPGRLMLQTCDLVSV